MPSFTAQLHTATVPTPSSSIAVPRSRCWLARQNFKGQISTQYSPQPGSVACTASAALAEEALSNGSRTEQLRGLAQEACAAGHLSQDGTAFLEEHRIRGYEVGPDQQTTIVTMANLLQVMPLTCPRIFLSSISMSICHFWLQVFSTGRLTATSESLL